MKQSKKLTFKLIRFYRKHSLPKHSKLIVLAVIVGIVVGLVSVGFKYLTELVQHTAFGITGEKLLEGLKNMDWWMILLIPALGGLLVGLLLNYLFSESKGGGVEEVMTSVATKRGTIRFKSVIGKLIASSITIGSGGSAGREGPIVQIGGGIGSSIGRWLKLNEEHVKTLVGAGVAAGIAAAFNAPIAGAFFALEIILGDFALNTFSTIILASVSATVVSRYFLKAFGDSPAVFPEIVEIVRDYSWNHIYEFGFYIILGVMGGLICVLFIKSLFYSEHFFSKLKVPGFVKPAIGGLLVGAIGLFVPHILGVGYDTMEGVLSKSHHLFDQFPLVGHLWLDLVLILGIKIVATSLTLGSGGAGGTIVPSLYLGSLVGGILGLGIQLILPGEVNSSSYALVGMAAIIAGTTQAPIMAMMLFFEATNNYQIILPVMTVSIISSLITKHFLGGSLYTVKLKSQGINLYEGIEKTVMSTIKASEIMKRNLYTFHVTTPFRKVLESFMNTERQVAFVLDDERALVGILSLSHMKTMIQDEGVKDFLIAGDLMIENTQTAYPDSTLSYCTELLAKEDIDIIPIIISETNNKLIGYLNRKDILSIYNLEVMKKNLSGLKFVSKVGDTEQRSYLDLSSKYRVETLPAPDYFINKSLKSLDTRKNYNVTVLAVQSAHSNEHKIPNPNTIFKKGDFLVVVGEHSGMNRFLGTL